MLELSQGAMEIRHDDMWLYGPSPDLSTRVLETSLPVRLGIEGASSLPAYYIRKKSHVCIASSGSKLFFLAFVAGDKPWTFRAFFIFFCRMGLREKLNAHKNSDVLWMRFDCHVTHVSHRYSVVLPVAPRIVNHSWRLHLCTLFKRKISIVTLQRINEPREQHSYFSQVQANAYQSVKFIHILSMKNNIIVSRLGYLV